MNETYRLSEACEVLDMKAGRIQNYMNAGWITPTVQTATGSGSRNIFSYNDLVMIEMLKVMAEDLRIPRKYAGELVKWIQNHKFYKTAFSRIAKEPYSYFEIYVMPDGSMETSITAKPDAFWQGRKKHKPAFVYSINLNHIIGKVELAAKK